MCPPSCLWYHIRNAINNWIGYAPLFINQFICQCFLSKWLLGQQAHQELQQHQVQGTGQLLGHLTLVSQQLDPGMHRYLQVTNLGGSPCVLHSIEVRLPALSMVL